MQIEVKVLDEGRVRLYVQGVGRGIRTVEVQERSNGELRREVADQSAELSRRAGVIKGLENRVEQERAENDRLTDLLDSEQTEGRLHGPDGPYARLQERTAEVDKLNKEGARLRQVITATSTREKRAIEEARQWRDKAGTFQQAAIERNHRIEELVAKLDAAELAQGANREWAERAEVRAAEETGKRHRAETKLEQAEKRAAERIKEMEEVAAERFDTINAHARTIVKLSDRLGRVADAVSSEAVTDALSYSRTPYVMQLKDAVREVREALSE